jgi:hypothetical protein
VTPTAARIVAQHQKRSSAPSTPLPQPDPAAKAALSREQRRIELDDLASRLENTKLENTKPPSPAQRTDAEAERRPRAEAADEQRQASQRRRRRSRKLRTASQRLPIQAEHGMLPLPLSRPTSPDRETHEVARSRRQQDASPAGGLSDHTQHQGPPPFLPGQEPPLPSQFAGVLDNCNYRRTPLFDQPENPNMIPLGGATRPPPGSRLPSSSQTTKLHRGEISPTNTRDFHSPMQRPRSPMQPSGLDPGVRLELTQWLSSFRQEMTSLLRDHVAVQSNDQHTSGMGPMDPAPYSNFDGGRPNPYAQGLPTVYGNHGRTFDAPNPFDRYGPPSYLQHPQNVTNPRPDHTGRCPLTMAEMQMAEDNARVKALGGSTKFQPDIIGFFKSKPAVAASRRCRNIGKDLLQERAGFP